MSSFFVHVLLYINVNYNIYMNAIEAKQLTKYYGKHKGIENLDLVVEHGDFFGFIGPNGAGKSTTIRTLLGLISPTGGTATIFDKDIVKDKKEVLKRVGYLPSEINYYSKMKVKDIIKHSQGLRGLKDNSKANSLCERLDLDINKRIDECSLGNRKKIGVICAIQHSPDLIILDEPTSGLDPLMQREFLNILEEENKRGATIFFSSHILQEVQSHCRSAAFIKDGKIIVSDVLENLEEAGAKKVIIRSEVDMELFNRLLGNMKDLKQDDKQISFLFDGDMKRLLAVLAVAEVSDVDIISPSLEELFMNYYES